MPQRIASTVARNESGYSHQLPTQGPRRSSTTAPSVALASQPPAQARSTDSPTATTPEALAKANVGIATAIALSHATVANMKQNLGFAFVYNALGVPLAAGLLFPFTGWLLSPMIAALAMSLSSASVISNALRLRGAKLDKP